MPPRTGVLILAADLEQRHGVFTVLALDFDAVPRQQGCIGGGGDLTPRRRAGVAPRARPPALTLRPRGTAGTAPTDRVRSLRAGCSTATDA